MSATRFQRAAEVFREACRIEPSARSAFLARACEGDAALEAEVRSLLDADTAVPEALRDENLEGGAAARAVDLLDEYDEVGRQLPERIGDYRILSRLGAGGMGIVYRAEQRDPRRIVALKVLRPGLVSRQALKRFEYECRVLARLKHPGIAQIHEAGRAQNVEGAPPFFAMEFVDGAMLTEYADAARLETRGRLELIIRICDAVQHAHLRGVMHRDLKPANILVESDGRPKVLDFGIARTTDSETDARTLRTEAGQLVGTVPYMSPEQLDGDPTDLDARCDVYALGAMLYELLTGRPPHDVMGQSIYESVRIVRESEPRRLGTIHRALRGDVETIVHTALAKDRDERYRSPGDLAADLQRHLSGDPITARRQSTLYVCRKLLARHRVPASLAAAIVVLLTVAGVMIMDATRDQRRIAHQAQGIAALLTDDLAIADPFRPTGPPASQLAWAAAWTDERLAGQPSGDAELRNLIGLGYLKLGRYEDAERQFRRALELRDASLDPPHADIAESMHNLGRAMYFRSRYVEAEALYAEALAMREQLFGAAHPLVADSLNDLAACAKRRGRLEEAERHYRRALEMRQTILDANDPWIAASMNNLATCLRDLGRYEEAEQLFREAVDRIADVDGVTERFVAAGYRNIARCRLLLNAPDEALSLLRASEQYLRAAVDEDHPDVAVTRRIMAACRLALGDLERAETLCAEALELQRRRFDRPHAAVADSMLVMARIHLAAGRLDEAEGVLNDVLADRLELFEPNHHDVAEVHHVRALSAFEREAFDRALQLAERAYEMRTAALPARHPEVIESGALVARCLTALDRTDEADRLLRKLDAIRATNQSARTGDGGASSEPVNRTGSIVPADDRDMEENACSYGTESRAAERSSPPAAC